MYRPISQPCFAYSYIEVKIVALNMRYKMQTPFIAPYLDMIENYRGKTSILKYLTKTHCSQRELICLFFFYICILYNYIKTNAFETDYYISEK